MKKLLSRASEKYNDGQGLYIEDFKHVLKWADLLDTKEANKYASRREKAHEESSRLSLESLLGLTLALLSMSLMTPRGSY